MDFKIDTEILENLSKLLSNKTETLNSDIENISSAIVAFGNGWEGEDENEFVSNCQKYEPVLKAVYETAVAYSKIVSDVAADATTCIQTISDAMSNIG